MFTLNCRGRLLTFDSPIIMGIINVTPDSFFSESRKTTIESALQNAAQMIKDGVTILDIGGQSTRPGSTQISAETEAERVLPVIKNIHQSFPETIISADTYYASVAEKAVLNGAGIINDISSGNFDKAMIPTVANLKTPFICMHMKGTPQTMQRNPGYENVTKNVLDYFIERVDTCRQAGIHDIIVDPGFGFGKTIAHNFELLHNLSAFKMLQRPILAGISRKSTIYKTLNVPVEDALNGTTSLNTIALLNGANILRVHDVKETAEVIKLHNKYRALGS